MPTVFQASYSIQDQINRLNSVLIRRGLRFPIDRKLREQLSGTPFNAIWSMVGALLSGFAFWILALAQIGIKMPQASVGALIIGSFQAGLMGILMFILSKGARFFSRRTRGVPRWMAATNSKLIGTHSKYLRLVGFAGLALFMIPYDLLVTWIGVLSASRRTNEDIFLALEKVISPINRETILLYFIWWVIAVSLIIIAYQFLRYRRRFKQFVMPTLKYLVAFVAGPSASFIMLVTVGFLLESSYPRISALLKVLAFQTLLNGPFLMTTFFILSWVTTTVIALPSLIKFRATVLGLTFLAATIPFLNADSWQLVSGMPGRGLINVAIVIYLVPILLLVYSQRRLLNREWDTLWHREVTVDELLSACREVDLRFDASVEQEIQSRFTRYQRNTSSDKSIVRRKYLLKGIFLLAILPISVFVFGLLLFVAIINNRILEQWTTDYYSSQSTHLVPLLIDGWTLLKVKSAILLAILSTTSTLGSLLASNEDLSRFVQESFMHDVQLDKHLLILSRVLQDIWGSEASEPL